MTAIYKGEKMPRYKRNRNASRKKVKRIHWGKWFGFPLKCKTKSEKDGVLAMVIASGKAE